ncbi:MAG: hypothetical protein ABIN35_04500 [candidate division WOR-3 bacterium]
MVELKDFNEINKTIEKFNTFAQKLNNINDKINSYSEKELNKKLEESIQKIVDEIKQDYIETLKEQLKALINNYQIENKIVKNEEKFKEYLETISQKLDILPKIFTEYYDLKKKFVEKKDFDYYIHRFEDCKNNIENLNKEIARNFLQKEKNIKNIIIESEKNTNKILDDFKKSYNKELEKFIIEEIEKRKIDLDSFVTKNLFEVEKTKIIEGIENLKKGLETTKNNNEKSNEMNEKISNLNNYNEIEIKNSKIDFDKEGDKISSKFSKFEAIKQESALTSGELQPVSKANDQELKLEKLKEEIKELRREVNFCITTIDLLNQKEKEIKDSLLKQLEIEKNCKINEVLKSCLIKTEEIETLRQEISNLNNILEEKENIINSLKEKYDRLKKLNKEIE